MALARLALALGCKYRAGAAVDWWVVLGARHGSERAGGAGSGRQRGGEIHRPGASASSGDRGGGARFMTRWVAKRPGL